MTAGLKVVVAGWIWAFILFIIWVIPYTQMARLSSTERETANLILTADMLLSRHGYKASAESKLPRRRQIIPAEGKGIK